MEKLDHEDLRRARELWEEDCAGTRLAYFVDWDSMFNEPLGRAVIAAYVLDARRERLFGPVTRREVAAEGAL